LDPIVSPEEATFYLFHELKHAADVFGGKDLDLSTRRYVGGSSEYKRLPSERRANYFAKRFPRKLYKKKYRGRVIDV